MSPKFMPCRASQTALPAARGRSHGTVHVLVVAATQVDAAAPGASCPAVDGRIGQVRELVTRAQSPAEIRDGLDAVAARHDADQATPPPWPRRCASRKQGHYEKLRRRPLAARAIGRWSPLLPCCTPMPASCARKRL